MSDEPKPTGLAASFAAKIWRVLAGLTSFLLWVVSGFGLLGNFGKGKHYKTDEVVLYEVNKAFFVWLPMLVGFISIPLARHGYAPEFLAWTLLAANMYVLLCILFDIDFLKLVIITLVIGFVWLLASFLKGHNILLLSYVATYITNIHPKIDPGFTVAWSWFLLAIFVASLIKTFGYGRVAVTSNSLEEWHLGMGTETTDRMGLKFRIRYYDLLELFLGLGAGTLEARRNDGSIVKKYDTVLFLFFWAKRLDEILNQRTTIIDNSDDSPVDVEDIHHGFAPPGTKIAPDATKTIR